jgi:hypothetical protein
MDDWNVHKTAEQRAKLRRRKATRNSVKNTPKKVHRFGNSFQNVPVDLGEDIPTSGEGWTLKSA